MITCLTSFQISLDHLGLCSGSKDKLIKLWDIGASLNYCTLSGHSGGISCLNALKNGGVVISGSLDLTVRVWRTKQNECLHIFTFHNFEIENIAFI